LLLALCLHLNIPIRTYVQEVDRMALGDWLIPPSLTRKEGLQHKRIRRRHRHSDDMLALYDQHTAMHSADVDRLFVARHQWDLGTSRDVVLRGHCFGVARRYFWSRLQTPSTPLGAILDGKSIATYFGEPENSSASDGLKEWVEWTKQNSDPAIDWRDRFFIEQRLAGWLSAIEQSLDLVNPVRFFPANSGRVLALLLRMPPENRVAAQTHVDIIERLAPRLNKLPYNPPNLHFGLESTLWFQATQDPLGIPKWFVNLPARLRRKIIRLFG
jgi:hypothetical protein